MARPEAVIFCRDATDRERWSNLLQSEGFAPAAAANPAELLDLARTRKPRVIVFDLPDTPPALAELLERTARAAPAAASLAVLEEEQENATRLLSEAGAVLVLPRSAEENLRRCAVAAAARVAQERGSLQELRRLERRRVGLEGIVGKSAAMEGVRETVERLALSTEPVWIFGEPGTGKTLVGRVLHESWGRAEAPWVRLAAEELAKQPLERGLLQAVEAGRTLLLHHVESLPHGLQERLAEEVPRHRHRAVRWILTTLEEPRRLAERGRLDPRLLELLAGTSIYLPPLRERLEDVPLLAYAFTEELCLLNAWPLPRFARETIDCMLHYPWPGNVRELRHAVEQALLVAGGPELRPEDLPSPVRPREAPRAEAQRFREAKREVIAHFELRYLERLMARHRGNVTAAAREAGMLRSALQRLLRKHHMRSADFRRPRERLHVAERPPQE